MKRTKRRALPLLLCLCMLLQTFVSAPALAATESGEPGDLLYFVNCAATNVADVAEGDAMGGYQSVTDQPYGEDAGTGNAWGYVEDEYMVRGGNADSVVKTDTYWYTSDSIQYDPETSGFRYNFAVENGSYEVTVGIKIPGWWGARTVDIDLEGTRTTDQASVPGGSATNATFERTSEIMVTDGELNVFVHNSKRTSADGDPILSYILVKRGEVYDKATLTDKIAEIEGKVEADQAAGVVYAEEPLGELYVGEENKEDNLQALNAVLASAKELAAQDNPSPADVKETCEHLDTVYSDLRSIETYDSFSGVNGDVWKDTNGKPIQAHGGQVQKLPMPDGTEKWWWVGEDKTTGSHSNGISAYSSDDLYNWTFEGYVMRSVPNREALDTDPYFTALYGDLTEEEKDYVYLCINKDTAIIERPKMIYNEATEKYIIWFHADGPTEESTSSYAAAAAGMAISDTPNGPFTFIRRSRLHQLPEEEYLEDNGVLDWYEEPQNRGFARDMNLFIDDDGTAYIIYSSEENRTMFISRLNDEYTDLDVPQEPVGLAKNGVDFVRLFPGGQREAPALFKYDGTYYMITSGATGWSPNPARYWKADEILGEWTDMGDPCIGDTDGKTFWSQSTNVIPVDPENGKFIYMGDRWGYGKEQDFSAEALADSRYIWLPVQIDARGNISLQEYNDWDLSVFDSINNIKLNSEMDDIYYGTENLPEQVNVSIREDEGWVTKDVNVSWDFSSLIPGAENTVTGTLEDANGLTITANVVDIPENLLYFIDSGATNGSELYDVIKEMAPNLVNTEAYDQAYTEGSWGYTGTDDDIAPKNPESQDAYTSGFWAKGGKNIDYKLPLKAGEYQVSLGFQEWWSTSRPMKVVVSYEGADGQTVETTIGTFTNSGEQAYLFPFTVENDADVTISVQRQNSNNPDPVLSWIALTGEVEEEPSEHMLTVTFPNTVELSIDGESQTIANLIGAYKDVVMADTELELTFTPRVEGREIAGVTVNGEAIAEDSFDVSEYVYSAAMPNADTTIELGFTVVDKQNLRAAIEIAEGRADEAAEAVPSVQEKYEAALQAAKDVEAKKTATQDEINTAWSDLIDALHYLSFVAGDKSQLEIPMEIADSINRDLFTPDSLAALDEAYAAAQDLLDDEEVLEADITVAVDALYDAIYDLVYRADITELEALVTKGDGIVANADQYIQNDAWTSFETSLEEAKTVLANENATQDAVDTAAEDLAAAISALRLIPDKDALEALIGEAEAINTNKYTAKSVATMKAALSTAKAVLNDAEATEEEVADAVEALENSIDGLVEKSTSTGSKNSGSTSANVGNAYGAAGIVSASQSVSAQAYVVSDTTVNFTLKRGSAYCFKMTVVNGNAMAPSFTVGNGDVLKTQFVAKVGNDYYYRVYATGTPGQSTGVYTTLPGNAAVKHCTVTIG